MSFWFACLKNACKLLPFVLIGVAIPYLLSASYELLGHSISLIFWLTTVLVAIAFFKTKFERTYQKEKIDKEKA